jgi:hypothetical protein
MGNDISACTQFAVRRMFAVSLIFLCIAGCEKRPASNMIPTEKNMIPMDNIPVDRTVLEPWFAGLLEKDAEAVPLSIKKRLSAQSSPELASLMDHVSAAIPGRPFFP